MCKAFFFDRDGIVNRRIIGGYVRTPAEFHFLPEIFPILRMVKNHGYLCILVTNQQGIGKRLMSESDLKNIHDAMQTQLINQVGAAFDDIYYCADLASLPGNCRKPSPAMLIAAMEKWSIEARTSWMIGDSPTDVEAGHAAGVRTILVGDCSPSGPVRANRCFTSLSEAQVAMPHLLQSSCD